MKQLLLTLACPTCAFSLPQQFAGRRCDGFDAEERQAVAGGASFGHSQAVASIETGHAGKVQAHHNGLLSRGAAGVWSPGFSVCQAKDSDGGSASRDREVDERGVVADKEVNLLKYCRGDFDAASTGESASAVPLLLDRPAGAVARQRRRKEYRPTARSARVPSVGRCCSCRCLDA